MTRPAPAAAVQPPRAPAQAETAFQARQQASEQTLAALASGPRPRGPDHRVRTLVEHLTADLAAACLVSRDPHRSLAGAAGQLLQLQADIALRSKHRPSREAEQAVAPPHRNPRR